MKKFQLVEGSFLKNLVILMFGSGLSQLIPFAFSIILSRLYTSSDYGIFTIFLTVSAFLGVLATFRYDLAIMLPAKKADSFHLLVLSIRITIILSLIILIITLIFPEAISRALSSKDIKPWLPLLSLSVLFLGITQAFNFWHNRNKSYKALSYNMISQSSTTATISTINGFAKMKAGGLIIGSISGQLVSTLLYSLKFISEDRKRLKKISWKRLKEVAKTYIEYPKFNLPHRLVDMISITGIPIILMMLFSQSIVGLYGFMLRVLKAPIAILASSLGQVFYQQFSEKVAKKYSVKALFTKTIRNIAFLTFPFFIIILFWGPQIFSVVFSKEWREAGVYAQYLTPWLFFSTIASPVSQVPLTLGYVKTNMFAGIINNFLLVMIFVVASQYYSDPTYVFLWVGTLMPVFYIVILLWFYRIILKYEKTRITIDSVEANKIS